MKTKLFITALAFFAITSVGFSQSGNPQDRTGRSQGKQGTQATWVDENKDGVCDNYEKGTPGQGNGNGFCGGKGQGQPGKGMMNGQGKGRFYADENKDGICDRNKETKDQPVKK